MRSPSPRHKPFLVGCFLLAVFGGSAWAAPSGEITAAEMDAKANRVLIALKGTVGAHRAQVMSAPNRLVVDFDETRMAGGAPSKIKGDGQAIHEIRLGQFNGRARVVVDFQKSAVPPYKISQDKDRVEVRFAPSVGENPDGSSKGADPAKAQSASPLSPEAMPAAAGASPADVKAPPSRPDSGCAKNPLRLAEARLQPPVSGSSQGKMDPKGPELGRTASGLDRKSAPPKSGKVAQTMELQRPEATPPFRREPAAPEPPPPAPGIPSERDSGPMSGAGPRMVREVRPPVTPPTPDPRLVVQEITELKFIQVGHNSRLIVRGGDHLDYRLNKISPTKVRLDLVNAEIPKAHQKPLRTDLFSTSVEMIVPGSQTIFVQLKDAVPYQVQKQKGVLMVDFPPPRFAMTEDQKAQFKGEPTGDKLGQEQRERMRERMREQRGAARAMR